MLKYAVQREHYADIAVESLSGGTVGRRRFWLIPTLLGPTALAAVFMVISTRSSRRPTLQPRAEITRLNNGLQPQVDLLQPAAVLRSPKDTNSGSGYGWLLCAKADNEGTGKGDCLTVLATFRARLWVARKLLPIKRTSPWAVRSKRICPSRVQSWLRTVNFVAPLTVVAARCVSLPAVYFSTVVFKIAGRERRLSYAPRHGGPA